MKRISEIEKEIRDIKWAEEIRTYSSSYTRSSKSSPKTKKEHWLYDSPLYRQIHGSKRSADGSDVGDSGSGLGDTGGGDDG